MRILGCPTLPASFSLLSHTVVGVRLCSTRYYSTSNFPSGDGSPLYSLVPISVTRSSPPFFSLFLMDQCRSACLRTESLTNVIYAVLLFSASSPTILSSLHSTDRRIALCRTTCSIVFTCPSALSCSRHCLSVFSHMVLGISLPVSGVKTKACPFLYS